MSELKLKRQLGLLNGIAIIMGLVVGGGIYITPSTVVRHLHSPGLTLLAWFFGGLVSLLGALCFAELGVAIPVSGEKYAYLRHIYGPFAGFVYIWQYLFLMRSGGNAMKTLVLGRYLLKPLFPHCAIPEKAVLLCGSSFAILLTCVNMRSVRMAATGQNLMTFISFLTLCLVSSVGLYYLAQGWTEKLDNPFADSNLHPASLAFGIYSAAYPYYGWSSLNFVIEELKNPNRNLPLSIITSIVITIIFYVGVNFTYLCVLGSDGVLTSQAVALSTVNEVSTKFGWVLSVLIAITACSSFNSGLLVGSRLAFVGARYGHLPQIFSFINVQYITPVTSLILQCLMVLLYVWFIDIGTIISNTLFSVFVFDLLVIGGYLRIKIQKRHIKTDQFQVPFIIHILYISCLVFLIVIPLMLAPLSSASGFLFVIVTSLPYYVIVVLWKSKPKQLMKRADSFNCFLQKLLMCAPEEKTE